MQITHHHPNPSTPQKKKMFLFKSMKYFATISAEKIENRGIKTFFSTDSMMRVAHQNSTMENKRYKSFRLNLFYPNLPSSILAFLIQNCIMIKNVAQFA